MRNAIIGNVPRLSPIQAESVAREMYDLRADIRDFIAANAPAVAASAARRLVRLAVAAGFLAR